MLATARRIKRKLAYVIPRLGRWESWRHASLKLRVAYGAAERPRRFPLRLQIEATTKCNLSCPTCSHSREKTGGQHLTDDALRRILGRLPWQPKRVVLSGIGEPLATQGYQRRAA